MRHPRRGRSVLLMRTALICLALTCSIAHAKIGDSRSRVLAEIRAEGYSISEKPDCIEAGNGGAYVKVTFKDNRATVYQIVSLTWPTDDEVERIQKSVDLAWTVLYDPHDPLSPDRMFISSDGSLLLFVVYSKNMIVIANEDGIAALTGRKPTARGLIFSVIGVPQSSFSGLNRASRGHF